MNTTLFSLNKADINQTVEIKKILTKGRMRRRLFDLGFMEDTLVKCLYKNSQESFIAYLIRGTVIALRDEDAKDVYCITHEFSLSLNQLADRSSI